MPELIQVPETAICRSCGYRLRSLPGNICPECGTEFDPLDPISYDDPARRARRWVAEKRALLRSFVSSPGLYSVVVLCSMLWLTSRTNGTLSGWLDFCWRWDFGLIKYLAVLEAVRLASALFIRRRLSGSLQVTGRWDAGRRAIVIVGVTLAVLWIQRPWVAQRQFYRSRAALEAAICRADAAGRTPVFDKIGEVYVRYIIRSIRRTRAFLCKQMLQETFALACDTKRAHSHGRTD